MGKLLSDFTAKPKHIPVCFPRIEVGDGGGRRLGSKNEFAAQSKTTQSRRGARKQHTCMQPSPVGAVCCHPGCESRTWQSAQLSGRDGEGGWRGSCQEQAAGDAHGCLDVFWTHWFSPVDRSDSRACRLGSGGS